jgi:hypothetical protein
MKRQYLLGVLGLVCAGCPFDPDTSGSETGAAGAGAAWSGVEMAAGGSAALSLLVDQATRDRFPPPPPLDTLCALQQGRTTFDGAKKLLKTPNKQSNYPGADPQSESQDASMAGLSYRFSAPAKASNEGDANAQAPTSVSLILRFTWSDGDVGWGTKVFGIGGSVEDFITGYVLKDMSITGQPYPGCWPHEEE